MRALVVNDADAAAFTLASRSPTKFTKPSSPRYYCASLRLVYQRALKRIVFVMGEVPFNLLGKTRRLN